MVGNNIPLSMHEALLAGDEIKIQNIINVHNLDINQQDDKGNTLLHYAVMSGNESSIRTILDLSPNTKVKNGEGRTPLRLSQDIGSKLPEDITFQLNDSPSKLYNILMEGNEARISSIIKSNNLDINDTYENGNTLLHCAVLTGNESSVKAVLDLKPDPTIKNKQGKTPLQLSQSIGGEIAENTTYQLDDHLRTEVIRSTPNKSFVKNLVLGGADPNSKDSQGKSAISILKSGGRDSYFSQDKLEPTYKEYNLLYDINNAVKLKAKEDKKTPKTTSKKKRGESIKAFIQGIRNRFTFKSSIFSETKNPFSHKKRNSSKTTVR